MRVVIDACVLFPTVLRELVIGVAETGTFTPLWSLRILEEWRRAAARFGPMDEAIAEAEIARLRVRFPDANVTVLDETQARLALPDPNDVHVLAAAVDGQADELLTLNTRDFPTNALAAENVIRRHPDEFLLEWFHDDRQAVEQVVSQVLTRARDHGIDISNRRAILKKARLPRLGKALDQV